MQSRITLYDRKSKLANSELVYCKNLNFHSKKEINYDAWREFSEKADPYLGKYQYIGIQGSVNHFRLAEGIKVVGVGNLSAHISANKFQKFMKIHN